MAIGNDLFKWAFGDSKKPENASSNVEKKTSVPTDPKTQAPLVNKGIKQGKDKNVLNDYRSSTYNFTIAALKKADVESPEKWRSSELELVILKSGGKGLPQLTATAGMSTDEIARKSRTDFAARDPRRLDLTSEEKNLPLQNYNNNQLIDGFNKNSPGRFDMFIDSVEIETLMAFSPSGGTTLPTGLKFEVIEPYSINGFIEALHVAAVAAGYPNYTLASFILKIEFVGYPDDDNNEFKGAKVIDKTTRYFVFKFTGLEVDIGEKGTRYRCAAVPFEQAAFGQPNKLKKPITMAGSTVAEVFDNFKNNLNSQIKDSDKASKTGFTLTDFDEFDIVFPTINPDGTYDFNTVNEIGKSKINEVLKESNIYKFPNPSTSTKPNAYQVTGSTQPSTQQQSKEPETVKYTPGTKESTSQIQFAEGQQIHEIIAAVIRDGKYIKDILEEKKIDDDGFVNYFLINTKVTNKSAIDPIKRAPYQLITYIVTPYRVHYTRIPTFGDQKYDESKINLLSLREYNYIYTGENIDILNFKLNFNTLFFEAIPAAMGNNDQPGGRDGAGKSNNQIVRKQPTTGDGTVPATEIPTGTVQADVKRVNSSNVNGGQPNPDDPYYFLARNMHEAIVNSNSSMLTGEIEILGDPFYLVTGGIGNYNPKTESNGLTVDGEADYLQREVLITINFRNPIDIDTLEKGGRFYFESKKLPFSGVYMVTKVTSILNNGEFKQRLEIIRKPGQIINNEAQPTDYRKSETESPKPLAQTTTDTTRGINDGNRADTLNLLEQLGRGLPSPGLPGELSNFTKAIGGLGGDINNLLNQVSGAVTSGIGKLTSANSVFGGSIPDGVNQLASGIRMQTSGLVNLVQDKFSSAASVVQSAKTLESGFSITGAANSIADSITSKARAVSDLVSIKGSGIGEGASIFIDKTVSIAQEVQQNATVVASDLISQTAKLPTELTLITGQAKNLGTTALASVNSLFDSGSSLVSSVGDKITGLTSGIPTDTTALASKLGINPSQISGLSSELKSKVLDQASGIAKSIPEDTDLSAAINKGLILDYVPSAKMKNIPATSPDLVAPVPPVDQPFISSIAKKGPQALADAYGVSDVTKIPGGLLPTDKINDILGSVSSGITNPLEKLSGQFNSTDLTALKGKLSSAGSQLSGITDMAGSVESKLNSLNSTVGSSINDVSNLSSSVSSKFGSISSGKSPLDKLMS